MKRFSDNTSVLWRYVTIAAGLVEGSVCRGNEINMRCNVCGDGKNKSKKRGYLIYDTSRDMIYYKCFNFGDCIAAGEGNAWSAKRWLKTYFPTVYKQYINEILSPSGGSGKDLSSIKVITKKPEDNEEAAVKHFVPLNKGDGKLFDEAKRVCVVRRLPARVYKKFFVATGGLYKERLIIPFYDTTGRIYYYQGRSLTGIEPKYLNRRKGRDEAIYNIHHIDRSKPVMITEGPIDSMFLENAVATLGISLSDTMKEKLDGVDRYWLYDYDKAGLLAAKKRIKNKEYVFLWGKFLKDYQLKDVKDVNDVYIKLNRKEQFSFEELNKYFSNNSFDQIYLI